MSRRVEWSVRVPGYVEDLTPIDSELADRRIAWWHKNRPDTEPVLMSRTVSISEWAPVIPMPEHRAYCGRAASSVCTNLRCDCRCHFGRLFAASSDSGGDNDAA